MSLLFAAAIGGAGTATLGPVDLFGLLAVVSFLGATGIQTYMLLERPDRSWWGGRAVAESVKTLAWRYACCGTPLQDQLKESAADAVFLQRVTGLLADIGDLRLTDSPSRAAVQITPAMRALRRAPLHDRVDHYLNQRLGEQQLWYARRARRSAYRGRQFAVAALTLEALGLTLGAAKSFTAVEYDLLGPLAAAAAGLVAWTEMRQHSMTAQAYSLAQQELATARSYAEEARRTEDAWAAYVRDTEEIMSREHTLWRARRGTVI